MITLKPKRTVSTPALFSTTTGWPKNLSQSQIHCDAALNALEDAGLKATDIDGVACAGEFPVNLAFQLGIVPRWIDRTYSGGPSFLLHVRPAAAAIEAGLCRTVLITHGESGKSRIGYQMGQNLEPSGVVGQFELPYTPFGAANMFTIPLLRYMKEFGLTEGQLAMISVG